jgi:hypothetical protein
VVATELSKTTYSVYQYVRKQKSAFKQLGRVKRNYKKRTKTDKSVVADKSVVKTFNTLKHGEFIIPVKSFEIRNDNGVTNLVLNLQTFIKKMQVHFIIRLVSQYTTVFTFQMGYKTGFLEKQLTGR